ncbi:MAG: hypothetical protein EAZ42_00370 [Verrucomicrobia bacterium]|nr:MAG: hypothetical protein EAZ42_00370 [Verrucomicrobiota bacterium]
MLDRSKHFRNLVMMLRILIFTMIVIHGIHAKPWYELMQIGPAWSNTFEDTYESKPRIAALKGVLLDLGENHRLLFDTETLRMVGLYQGPIRWGGTPWTGSHGELVGMSSQRPLFITPTQAGWANTNGSFDDVRPHAGHGNLPYGRYLGHYRHGEKIVFNYEIHGANVLETSARNDESLARSFHIGPRPQDLILILAESSGNFTTNDDRTKAKSSDGLNLACSAGVLMAADPKRPTRLLAKIPKGDAAIDCQFVYSRKGNAELTEKPDIVALTQGGPAIYPTIIETPGTLSTSADSCYATDSLSLPQENPWKAFLRVSAFDFLDADTAVISTWNGDVWKVKGLAGNWKTHQWQRIASGLFEPLGLKVVAGKIYVNGRDQISELIDLNGDGEIDHYKVFNRDVLITQNFHEFAFDLETDALGNFYFAKSAPVLTGGGGFDKILPHHGIVAKIPPDGNGFEIVATGLRAPGGIGIGPNGEITTGENEGTWQPVCKINYLKAGETAFFGTEEARGMLKDAPLTEPICYLPKVVDNSGSSQVWVPEKSSFGIPSGTLLHLSYGKSTIYQVLTVQDGDSLQGGVVRLPISLASSAMRARFHPDGSLYVCGFRGWQTNAATESAFQRVRYLPEQPLTVPVAMKYTESGVILTFPKPLDAELANDKTSFTASRWKYIRSTQYGSGEFSIDRPDRSAERQALVESSIEHSVHDSVSIRSVKLLEDGMSVAIEFSNMIPAMTLKLSYDLEDTQQTVLQGEIYATVHEK